MARAITQRDSYREARIQAHTRADMTARQVKNSTEAPPPKSLEEEPGNVMTYSLNDILDDVIAHHQWMM